MYVRSGLQTSEMTDYENSKVKDVHSVRTSSAQKHSLDAFWAGKGDHRNGIQFISEHLHKKDSNTFAFFPWSSDLLQVSQMFEEYDQVEMEMNRRAVTGQVVHWILWNI